MTTESMAGRDLSIRRTQADGRSYITHHRVWNADLFVARQIERVREASEDQERQDDKTRVVKVEAA